MEPNTLDLPVLESHLALSYDDVTSIFDWLVDPAPFSDEFDDLPERYKKNRVDEHSLPLLQWEEGPPHVDSAAVSVSTQELAPEHRYGKWLATMQRLYEMRCGNEATAEKDEAMGGFVVFISRDRPVRENVQPDVRNYVWHLPDLQEMQMTLTLGEEDVADVEEDNFPELLERLQYRGEGYESDVLDLFYCVYFPILNYRVSAEEACANAFGPRLDQLKSDATEFIHNNLESFCAFFGNQQLPVWMHRQYATLRHWLDNNQLMMDEFIMWCNYLVAPGLESHASVYSLGEDLLQAFAVNAIVTARQAKASFTPADWLDDRFRIQHDHSSTPSVAETTDVEEEADESDGVPALPKDATVHVEVLEEGQTL